MLLHTSRTQTAFGKQTLILQSSDVMLLHTPRTQTVFGKQKLILQSSDAMLLHTPHTQTAFGKQMLISAIIWCNAPSHLTYPNCQW